MLNYKHYNFNTILYIYNKVHHTHMYKMFVMFVIMVFFTLN